MNMDQCLPAIVGTALFAIASLSTPAGAQGLDKILTMQNFNGNYQAICQSGSGEVLTTIDLKLNNACPKKDPNRPNGMLAIAHLEDGRFDVTCKDLARFHTDANAIIEGTVCEGHGAESTDLMEGIGDSRNIQGVNGKFNIICANGTAETVTALDVRLDNVCPTKPLPPEQRSILTMHRNDDATFKVTCMDLSTVAATVAQLRAGSVCRPVFVGPRRGEYIVESGYSSFCRQKFESTVTSGAVTAAKIAFIGGCSGEVAMTCAAGACSGSYNGTAFKAKLMDSTHYEFTRVSDSKVAIFKFDRESTEE